MTKPYENNIYINDLVSIITPAYNCDQYIAETIHSVLNQTYSQWEMIIVDDASTDNTVKILESYIMKDDRIKVISLKGNQGVANARNVGMRNARGRYLAFLDSDDIWNENKLERQLQFMQFNDIAFSFSQYHQFVDEVSNLKKFVNAPKVIGYKDLLKGNCIGCLTVILDRAKIPKFVMTKDRHEDYIAWLGILKQGFYAYGLQEDLARYRVSSCSLSGNKIKSALWTWKIYRRIEKKSIITSIYYFICYIMNALRKHY